MNYLDIVKIMRRHGYESIRLYSHSEVWARGDKQIQVPYLSVLHRRVAKDIIKQIYEG